MPAIKRLAPKIIGAIRWLLSFAVVGLTFYSCQWLGDTMCGTDIHKEYLSPNGKIKAVVFQRDCGATTEFSTQISILSVLEELGNNTGTIFIIDGDPQDVAPHLEWVGNNWIKVFRKLTGKEYMAKTHYGWINSINIEYR